jgi:hypothetical protein
MGVYCIIPTANVAPTCSLAHNPETPVSEVGHATPKPLAVSVKQKVCGSGVLSNSGLRDILFSRVWKQSSVADLAMRGQYRQWLRPKQLNCDCVLTVACSGCKLLCGCLFSVVSFQLLLPVQRNMCGVV